MGLCCFFLHKKNKKNILAISGKLDTRVRFSDTYLFPAMVFGGIQIDGIFYSASEVKDKKTVVKGLFILFG